MGAPGGWLGGWLAGLDWAGLVDGLGDVRPH